MRVLIFACCFLATLVAAISGWEGTDFPPYDDSGEYEMEGDPFSSTSEREYYGDMLGGDFEGEFDVQLSTENPSSVSGVHKQIITPAVQRQFGLGDTEMALKKLIAKHFGRGVIPLRACLSSLSVDKKCGARYREHGIPDVVTVVQGAVESHFRDNRNSKKMVIAEAEFSNRRKKPVHFSESLSHQVSDSMSVTYSASIGWSLSGSLGVSVKLFSPSGSLSTSGNLGVNVGKSESSSVGTSTNVNFDLESGESVIVSIISTLSKGKAKVEFDATLEGKVVVIWAGVPKVYSFDINDVLQRIGKPVQSRMSMIVNGGFYVKKIVDIVDADTNSTLASYPIRNGYQGPINFGLLREESDEAYGGY